VGARLAPAVAVHRRPFFPLCAVAGQVAQKPAEIRGELSVEDALGDVAQRRPALAGERDPVECLGELVLTKVPERAGPQLLLLWVGFFVEHLPQERYRVREFRYLRLSAAEYDRERIPRARWICHLTFLLVSS